MRVTSPETLQALMRQRGLSIGRLARAAGCSKGFISHLLSGRRRSCTPALAQRITAVLDVPLEIVFVATDPELSPPR